MTIRRRRAFTRPLGLLCSTTLTGSLLLSAFQATPAHAQVLYGATGGKGSYSGGGDGVDGGDAGQDGEAGSGAPPGAAGAAGTQASPNGGDGGGAILGTGGGGGGGYTNILSGDIVAPVHGGDGGNAGRSLGGIDHAGGGAGGDGALYTQSGLSISVAADVHGGNGGSGNTSHVVAGGGGGGAGLVLKSRGTAIIQSEATVSGGAGGNSEPNSQIGGGGGAGAIFNAGGSLTNNGDIVGGDGGIFGTGGAGVLMGGVGDVTNSGMITGGRGGLYAPASAAIDLRNGGTIFNSGEIIGGEGNGGFGRGIDSISGGVGSGGAPGSFPVAVTRGDGGTGIIGADISIVNAGTIAGGISYFGQANAITFTGGANRLELWNGSTLIGNVDANAGTDDVLALGGDDNGSFDLTAIGDAGQYRGFELFEKTGAGTWTLTSTTEVATPWTLVGGTLSVSSDEQLGAPSEPITFNGGALQNTAAFTTARNVILNAGGGTFQADASLSIAGTISGAGALTKTGANQLVLASANDYAGGTSIEAGSVEAVVTGALGTGPVTVNQAALSFRNDASAGALAITSTQGSVNFYDTSSAQDAKIINNAGSLVDISGLTADGIGIGSLSGDGSVRLGAKTLTLGGLGVDDRINGVIEDGPGGTGGALAKIGTGTLTLTGANTYTGSTTVNAGTLNVNGTLGGTLDVMTGGRLQGTGSVGTTTIASGATIAPGNSIGTLTVDGDISFAAGSIYEAEINPALERDLIDVSGTATINGGTVHAVKAGGVYTPGSRWTILGADGGVSGAFDDLTQNMPFVDLALDYDDNNVYIDATRNAVAFCDVAQTRNQCAAGGGLESAGTGNSVYDALAAIPDAAGVPRALDALSGEIHASIQSALIEDSRFVRDAVNDRLRAAFAGAGSSAAPVLAYGAGSPVLAPAATGRLAGWGAAFGSWGSFDGNGNAAALDTSTGGFLTGLDGWVNDKIRLGFMAGYSHTSFDIDDRSSSGSSDNYHLGLYGGTQWGALGLRSGLAYTWHDVETSRSVAMPGFADRLSGDYSAGALQAFGELGYRIDTRVAAFEPFVNLAHVNLKTDGFSEEGGAAALTSHGETSDTTFTTVGLRASTGFTLGAMKAMVRGMLGWRHAYGDIMPTSTHAFSGGDAFTIAGVPIAKNGAVIETGLDFNLTDTATLGVDYQGQLASGAEEHRFSAKLKVKF